MPTPTAFTAWAPAPGWRVGPAWSPAVPGGALQPAPVSTFPNGPLALRVSVALDTDPTINPDGWVFTDISSRARYANRIVISRGRTDEQTQGNPSTCAVTLDNTDGALSLRNITSPYHGKLKLNTPLRVELNRGTGWFTRFTGTVPGWPPRSDVTRTDRYVPVVASGVLRRLGQGRAALRSPMYRTTLDDTRTGGTVGFPVAYWSCEDGSGAIGAAPVIGPNFLLPSGDVSFGAAGPPGAAGAITIGTSGPGRLAGSTGLAAASDRWAVGFAFNLAQITSGGTLAVWYTTGTIKTWAVQFGTGSPDTINLVGYDGSGALASSTSTSFVDFSSVTEPLLYDTWVYGLVVLTEDGAGNVNQPTWVWYHHDTLTSPSVSGYAGTVGCVTGFAFTRTGGLTTVNGTHPAIWTDFDTDGDMQSHAIFVAAAMLGYDGERPVNRFSRLCREEGIAANTAGSVSAATMGPQGQDTLLGLLRSCEAAENGLIVERVTGHLGFDRLDRRANQAPVMVIDYSLAELTPPFEPTDDDLLVRNDVTVSRTASVSAARAVDSTSALGTGGNGVGTYTDAVTLNLQDDGQLIHQASWRLHVGTTDVVRVPRLTLHLSRPETAHLIDQWLQCDVGSRIQIINPPDDFPPDPIDLVIEGYTETLDQLEWVVQLNLSPYRPYETGVLASETGDGNVYIGHYDWDTCVLAEDLTTTETLLDVTTTPLITTVTDNFPLDILIGDERITVRSCSGGSNPQTLTTTRSVNGVVATHSVGDVVTMHPSSARYGAL